MLVVCVDWCVWMCIDIHVDGWMHACTPDSIYHNTTILYTNSSGSKRARRDEGSRSNRLREEDGEDGGDPLAGIDEERLLEVCGCSMWMCLCLCVCVKGCAYRPQPHTQTFNTQI